MAKKQTTDDRRLKTEKAGPVATVVANNLGLEMLAQAGVGLKACELICRTAVKSAKDAAPFIKDLDAVIELAAQLARGAKNRVQGVCFDAGKYAMISKPKLNELKKALRKVEVKI